MPPSRLATLRRRLLIAAPSVLALSLAIGWATREAAFAKERADAIASQTVNLAQVKMEPFSYENRKVGAAGAYVSGDTPASTKFITGRFVLEPGQTPHKPHTHAEEEVMIVETGTGEIFCDGKTTKVGPGSVMYTTPNAPHGIVNTGEKPLIFYFVKWAGVASK
ncbi:MAG: mannose-6-phosphate isomerase [Planctomycetota bacterium]|nr:mannose-6-phosphate isomerase [Planctomycetota bacterium]